ncbi:MAG: glycine cleavage system protein GcvH [Chthonomonadales bacterium]|nr:glycine cleavage system protein GcvH [Chthonomonadales bacterium]
MSIPDGLLYTRTHEWIRKDATEWTIGITDHAQTELGDVVYVELPEAGAMLDKDAVFGTVESVKAVSDLYAPIAGKVLEANLSLSDNTAAVNQDPYGSGWMIRIEPHDIESSPTFLSAAEYAEYLKESDH